MWHWDKEVNDDFTGDFGRHRTWRSAHSGLRHRYPQRRSGHGASLQPGSSKQVRNAGTHNTRKNKAECFDFQSCLRSRLYCLCAGVRLCGERCTGLSCGLLANARYFIGDEPDGPFPC